MQKIEDDFQCLATQIVNRGLNSLTPAEHISASRFFALWHLRSHHRRQQEPDHIVKGMPGESLSNDQEEILERKHVKFARTAPGGASVPGRMILGLSLLRDIDRITTTGPLRDKRWGIVRASKGEFIIPDIVDIAVIPVAPNIALICEYQNAAISESQVTEIDRKLCNSAIEYLIACDFGECPL